MARRELTQLDRDMIECEKAGFGVHYGAWKAAQKPVPIIKKADAIPEGWRVCIGCRKLFKRTTPNSRQIYCDVTCQKEHYKIQHKQEKALRESERRIKNRRAEDGK